MRSMEEVKNGSTTLFVEGKGKKKVDACVYNGSYDESFEGSDEDDSGDDEDLQKFNKELFYKATIAATNDTAVVGPSLLPLDSHHYWVVAAPASRLLTTATIESHHQQLVDTNEMKIDGDDTVKCD
ncbi:hypothetical protein L1987_12950 [Smallanthus sonchifolius]|uniref:Uncharacterized protein n=1 Tax=Smallanthus sonchifolius TaxID=185202 RepID=A0ACB9JG45_9ASTR|nr:hypothetical protein L1987_12950 [Smallanthus sonchifolius]